MHKLSLIAALAMGAASALRAGATPLLVDEFDTTQGTSTSNGASGFGTASSLTTSYGSRSLNSYVFSNAAPGDARDRTAIEGGAFTFSSDVGVVGLGYVDYFFAPLINVSPEPKFTFTVLSNDQPGVISIFAVDSAHQTSGFTIGLPAVSPTDTPLVLTAVGTFSGIDLTNVRQLEFQFGDTAGEDLRIGRLEVTATPEPTAALSGLIGLASLSSRAVARRRRRISAGQFALPSDPGIIPGDASARPLY